MTTTVTVQVRAAKVPPNGTVSPVKLRLPLVPPTKKLLPAPTQVPPAAAFAKICMFAGRVSLKLAPVSGATLLAFTSVKVIVLLAPSAIDAGANAFAMVGGSTAIRVAVAGSGLVDPSTVTNVLAAIVLT
ncbi:MAG: hypothetical protein IPK27_20760 [Rhodanobacteraceae bacterium]|nr:hypothetical protein [Rhodanobacteraceae bacterium]